METKIVWGPLDDPETGILQSNTGKYRARITRTMPDGTTKQFSRDALTLSDARAYRISASQNERLWFAVNLLGAHKDGL